MERLQSLAADSAKETSDRPTDMFVAELKRALAESGVTVHGDMDTPMEIRDGVTITAMSLSIMDVDPSHIVNHLASKHDNFALYRFEFMPYALDGSKPIYAIMHFASWANEPHGVLMKNETIVDRVVERLKLQPLGDLITEEDLHDIVKQAIPKTFFEKRTEVDQSSYNPKTVYKDPLIVEVMRDLLKKSVEDAVRAWINENRQPLIDHWKQVMDTGIVKYVRDVQNREVTAHLNDVLSSVVERLNSDRSSRGESKIAAPWLSPPQW